MNRIALSLALLVTMLVGTSGAATHAGQVLSDEVLAQTTGALPPGPQCGGACIWGRASCDPLSTPKACGPNDPVTKEFCAAVVVNWKDVCHDDDGHDNGLGLACNDDTSTPPFAAVEYKSGDLDAFGNCPSCPRVDFTLGSCANCTLSEPL